MSTNLLLQVLLLAVTSTIAIFIVPLFILVVEKIRLLRMEENAMVDDAILDALEIGVSNALDRESKAPLISAVETARELLKIRGIALERAAGPKAVNEVVYRLMRAAGEKRS